MVPHPFDHGLALIWPNVVEESYFTLLKEQQPMALIILARYGVVLHAISDQWWSKGWGRQVIEAISKMLDAEWQPSIHWAMKELGMRHDE